MIVKVNTGALSGLDGKSVIVEADFSNGLPAFDVVGLPDATVREAKERVRAALKNSGFEFPAKRAVINLAPADLKKEGTQFDLPIAISIMANGVLTYLSLILKNTVLEYIGMGVLAVGLAVGLIINFYAIKKYNGKIF